MGSFVLPHPHVDEGSGYHSHPQSQRTEWLRWGLIISFLRDAHNHIHICSPIVPAAGSVRVIAVPESSRAARPDMHSTGETCGHEP
jgi:hypothetical protein